MQFLQPKQEKNLSYCLLMACTVAPSSERGRIPVQFLSSWRQSPCHRKFSFRKCCVLQSLQKLVLWYLLKLDISIPYDPAIPFHQKKWVHVFIKRNEDSCIIYNNPKLGTIIWWYIHTMKYYTTLRMICWYMQHGWTSHNVEKSQTHKKVHDSIIIKFKNRQNQSISGGSHERNYSGVGGGQCGSVHVLGKSIITVRFLLVHYSACTLYLN